MKMNLGCGPVIADGWVNVDIDLAYHHLGTVAADVAHWLPFDDDVFDGIVANHSLQCLTANELPLALDELHRVLKPGGILRILVPDVLRAFNAYWQGDKGWPGFVAIEENLSIDEKFCRYLTWGGTNRSCFTTDALLHILTTHDFKFPANVAHTLWIFDLDSRLDESIAVTVSK